LLADVRKAAVEDGYRNDALLGYLRTLLAQFSLKVQEIFTAKNLQAPLARYAAEVTERNLRTQIVGIDPTFGQPTFVVLRDTYIENNVKLIKTIPEQDLASVEKIFSAPENVGRSVGELSDMLEERFDVSKSRAQRIARDQTLKLNAGITAERQRLAGISRYIWTTSKDERVRGNPLGKWPLPKSGLGGDHYRLDGSIQTWNAPPIVNTATLRRAHPGFDYECRCTPFPILEGIDDV
jgi:uncharacterized protein with gpF-like domain